jgi:heat shock protein HslJ
MNDKSRIVVLGLLAVGLAGCESVAGPSATDLQGHWQLVSLQEPGQPQVAAPAGATFSADFGSDGRVSLVADCNRCNSSYVAGGATLQVGNMACTRAYCTTAPLDTRFAALVQSAQAWRVGSDELELSSPEGTLRLRR